MEISYELRAILLVEIDGFHYEENFDHQFKAIWKGKHPEEIQVPDEVKNSAEELSVMGAY